MVFFFLLFWVDRRYLCLISPNIVSYRKNNGSEKEEESDYFDDAFPDYFESYDDSPNYDPTLLEGSIQMDPLRSKNRPKKRIIALKMGKDKKMRSQLMNIRQLPPSDAALLVRQLGLNTVTTKVTVITSKTITSYPACSTQGDLVECT